MKSIARRILESVKYIIYEDWSKEYTDQDEWERDVKSKYPNAKRQIGGHPKFNDDMFGHDYEPDEIWYFVGESLNSDTEVALWSNGEASGWIK